MAQTKREHIACSVMDEGRTQVELPPLRVATSMHSNEPEGADGVRGAPGIQANCACGFHGEGAETRVVLSRFGGNLGI